LGTCGAAGTQSEASDLNDRDEVVGGTDTPAGQYRAFFKEAATLINEGFVDLGVLPGGNRSLALGVNNGPLIVGQSRTTSTGAVRAFLAAPCDGGMVRLSDKVSNGAGWTLVSAEDINEAGWIVGYGLYDGYTTAFVLTPNY
jgi:uncharacterized membrane protein